MLSPPDRSRHGMAVVFIAHGGVPVELLEFDGPEHEVRPGSAAE